MLRIVHRMHYIYHHYYLNSLNCFSLFPVNGAMYSYLLYILMLPIRSFLVVYLLTYAHNLDIIPPPLFLYLFFHTAFLLSFLYLVLIDYILFPFYILAQTLRGIYNSTLCVLNYLRLFRTSPLIFSAFEKQHLCYQMRFLYATLKLFRTLSITESFLSQ